MADRVLTAEESSQILDEVERLTQRFADAFDARDGDSALGVAEQIAWLRNTHSQLFPPLY